MKPTNLYYNRDWLFQESTETSIFFVNREQPHLTTKATDYPQANLKNIRTW